MSDKNFYVLGDDNCKYEGMSKEQIIATIQEAISTGTIPELDAGVITKIKEQNKQRALSFWVGSQAEYNAIQKKADNCFYIINNSGNFAELKQKVDEDSKALQGLTNNFEEFVKKNGFIVEEYHGSKSHYFKFSNGLEIEFGEIYISDGGKTIYSDCPIILSNKTVGNYQKKLVSFQFNRAHNIKSLNVSLKDNCISDGGKLFQAIFVEAFNGSEGRFLIDLNDGSSYSNDTFNKADLVITYSAFGFDYGN